MILINIFLYGKPSWDMKIEGKRRLNPEILKKQGNYLKEHMYEVADIVKKLQKANWEMSKAYGALYSLEFSKEGLNKKEAEIELKKIGVSIKSISIEEFEDEEAEEGK